MTSVLHLWVKLLKISNIRDENPLIGVRHVSNPEKICATHDLPHRFLHTHRRVAADMGINELWVPTLEQNKKAATVSFSIFQGIIVGIDLSVWLHKSCHTDTIALRPVDFCSQVRANRTTGAVQD